MRSDGTEFPVELIVTRPDVPGPAVFCGYLRDMTETKARERDQRRLVQEQAALRRVATAVAASTDPRRVFGVVTEEVARLLGAQSSNMVRFDDGLTATVVGGWSEAPCATCRSATPSGSTATPPPAASSGPRRPARIDDYDAIPGELALHLRGLGFRCAVAAPIFLGGRLWGAVIVSSIDPEPFPAGAEQRIADFAELAAQALANANAREELAASRARIVAAGDAERRRLERNLHDGAQQRLVSLALMLRLAARRHPGDPDLERAGDELTHALQELRELARGIHPAVLTERGLEPAVEALADARAAAGRARRRAGRRAAARPGRGRRLLRGRRGADQRRQVRAGVGGDRRRRARQRARLHRGPRRRRRRRGHRRAAPGCAGSRTASRRSAGGSSSTAPPGPERRCVPRSP